MAYPCNSRSIGDVNVSAAIASAEVSAITRPRLPHLRIGLLIPRLSPVSPVEALESKGNAAIVSRIVLSTVGITVAPLFSNQVHRATKLDQSP